jgi:hypothetical protein
LLRSAEIVGGKADRNHPDAATRRVCTGQPHYIVGERRNDTAVQIAACVAMCCGNPNAEPKTVAITLHPQSLPRIGDRAAAKMRLEAGRRR